MSDPAVVKLLREKCRELGFARWGICPNAPAGHIGSAADFVREGRHGSMHWLAETMPLREDPANVLADVRSLIVVADLYHQRGESAEGEAHHTGRGKIARYARGRDYHKVLKKRLIKLSDYLRDMYPAEKFRVACDTAPLAEREHAVRAGLGWMGKNTLLINPDMGSYFFLGTVLTTAVLPVPAGQGVIEDHCGNCRACLDACPTNALQPYRMDARRCISFLTIENRGEPPLDLAEGVGDWLFGCDVCQEVCPHNSAAASRDDDPVRYAAYDSRRSGFVLTEILRWNETDRQEAFQGTALKRARLNMFRRNAATCLGNDEKAKAEPDTKSLLKVIANDPAEEEMVKKAAAWALRGKK